MAHVPREDEIVPRRVSTARVTAGLLGLALFVAMVVLAIRWIVTR